MNFNEIEKITNGIEFDHMPNEKEYEEVIGDKSVSEFIYIGTERNVYADNEGNPRFDSKGNFEKISSFNSGLIQKIEGKWIHMYHMSKSNIGDIVGFKVYF